MIELIQIVALDRRGFIRIYKEFSPEIDEFDNISIFIRLMLRDKHVDKIEIKKWRE